MTKTVSRAGGLCHIGNAAGADMCGSIGERVAEILGIYGS